MVNVSVSVNQSTNLHSFRGDRAMLGAYKTPLPYNILPVWATCRSQGRPLFDGEIYMTQSPLIYRHKWEVILIDPEREIVVGTYNNDEQARRAWCVYMAQGRVGTGYDLTEVDEMVVDYWRVDSQQFNARCEIKR